MSLSYFQSAPICDIVLCMAYEVTATRRRPQKFEDIIGQDFIVATLQKSVTAGKIAHAYLFSGPRGCGKTSSARIFAKTINCETGPNSDPCGKCAACTEITRGSSLDVIEIDGASNTSVNDVRQIKEEVQFPPNSCRYKVYIIDEVHMLSTSAFNALLKTIEEPPPYVIFIFATTELHKVPATIKSRCQQFNFRLVSVEQLQEALSETVAEMGIIADDEALFWVAREATGSVRDAYTLLDQVTSFSDGNISFEKIRDKLGLVGVERINSIVEACVEKDSQVAFTFLDEIIQNGVSIEQLTVDMANYFRNMLLLRSGITKESLLGQKPERFSICVQKKWTNIQIERALGIVLQLYRDIRYSLDPRYEFELAISRLSWISDYVSSVELKGAITQTQKFLLRNNEITGEKDSAHQQSPNNKNQGPNEDQISEKNSVKDIQIDNPFAEIKQRINEKREEKKTVEVVTSPLIPDNSASFTSGINDILQDENESGIIFSEMKEKLVSFFQTSKNMVATSLQKTFDWIDTGTVVRFSVDTPFVHNFLEQEHKALSEAISKLLCRPIGIEIILDSKGNIPVKGDTVIKSIPTQVEMVRHMFKGTIVGEG